MVYIFCLTRFASSSNSELLFAALAPSPCGSWFGVAKAVASGTSCLLRGGLAMFGVTFRFGVVNDVLEPVFTLLLLAVSFGVDGGAFALVRHDPAPAARRGPGRILFPTPVADHDWPSSLLPHGFGPDISLSATLRWAENCAMTWLLRVHWLSLPLACCLHSILVGCIPLFLVTIKGSNVSLSKL